MNLTMELWLRPVVVAVVSMLVMAALWFVQKRTRDAGVVDVAWAALLGGSAVLYAATGEGDAARRALLAALGGLWGFRLAFYLLVDRVLKGEEDGRYRTLRERWGAGFDAKIFWLFQIQAAFVVILSGPFLLISRDATPGLGALDFAGAGLWLVGIVGESIADRQLARFRSRAENKGRTCREGLWRYSRHPNYFFEWLIWCGFGVMALGAPWGWLGLLAPAFMLLLITKVTGIPPTEAQALKSRGEDYRKYQRETSAFFPWFPRKGALP